MALTHRSYSYENGGLPTNERLEFLGDAVLGLTITEELYHRHPDRPEGDLAKLRASIVNTQALADVGRKLGLGNHLLLGKGEESSGGADKSSILADGVESLLGAIYLEQGNVVAPGRRSCGCSSDLLDTAPTLGAGLDWKSSLQELSVARGWARRPTPSAPKGPTTTRNSPRSWLIAERRVRARASGAPRKRPNSRRRRRGAPSAPRAATRPGMPELPEVEVVRRGLAAHVLDRTITDVQVLHPRAARRHVGGSSDLVGAPAGQHRSPGPAGAENTCGSPLASGDALVVHLGMSGQMLLGRPCRTLASADRRDARQRASRELRRPAHLRRLDAHRHGDHRRHRGARTRRAYRPGPAGPRASTATVW